MTRLTRFVPALAILSMALSAVAPAGAQDGTTRSRRVDTPPQSTAPSAPAGQKPDVTFNDEDTIQLSTDVVNVLFSVTDHQNRFVPDITAKDVVITEGGVSQEVFSFTRESNLPLEVAILVDVSSSQEFTFADEKRAALSFLSTVLKPRRDSAAVVTFREDVYWVQGLTNRLERVNEAFNRLSWESRTSGGSRYGATALYDAIGITATELFSRGGAAPDDPATTTRRAIVLLTDGDDNASDRKLQDAIDEALRSDIIVYSIGIGDRYRSTAVKRDVLDVLSRQTGGRAYFPEGYDDLKSAFSQIEEELRSQYLLSYEPKNIARDGSFREIEIAIPGRQNIKIFHRKGYYAPRPDASGTASPGAPTARP
jgi:Ca-activated chloride channel family protein